MSLDSRQLRLDGVYQQDARGHLMLRIKIPAGVLSSVQAEAIADLAQAFGRSRLHLTTRGSVELHWLRDTDLPAALRGLAAVGLTSRGACGGAVRGIACSTTFSPAFGVCQTVARKLNRHFAGNPHFEGLPKKFKIGIDGDYPGGRHLIQDVGLVYVGSARERPLFDVWCAGGLGREPRAGFLLERAVGEERLIPLTEAVIAVYRHNTPPPKRLKHLVADIGEGKFRELLHEELAGRPEPGTQPSLAGALTPGAPTILETPIFAGETDPGTVRALAGMARRYAGGFLALTGDQNIALLLENAADSAKVKAELAALGLDGEPPGQQQPFRVCPGNHECRMGLCATRDIARTILDRDRDLPRHGSLAISGCPNSCSQPQLAATGIVCRRLGKTAAGSREPRFTLYRRSGDGLGNAIAEDLSPEALLDALDALD